MRVQGSPTVLPPHSEHCLQALAGSDRVQGGVRSLGARPGAQALTAAGPPRGRARPPATRPLTAACFRCPQVRLPAHFERTVSLHHLYTWFLARRGYVRRLDVDLGSHGGWGPLHALLGMVGPGLEHLRVYGDSESAFDAGSAAPWLALAPRLKSLELENAVDWTIDKACFPPGGAPGQRTLRGCRGTFPCRSLLQRWLGVRSARLLAGGQASLPATLPARRADAPGAQLLRG